MGMSDTGEPTYSVTEKCKEIMPDLYAEMRMDFNSTVSELWSLGIIDYHFAETNDDDLMRLSDEWTKNTKKAIAENKLNINHKSIIKGLIDSEVEELKALDFSDIEDEL